MSVSMNHQLETTMKITIKLALALAALSTAPAFAHDKHGHGNYSAGEPGDPKKPARTIEILLNEMDYTPAKIEVKRGEQIRFVLRNVGKEDHEFLLATTKENLAHAVEMKKHPHMEHDDPNAVRLAPKKTTEILWKFSKPGTFEYSCLIPDHREYGMVGQVTVK
ncbi:copper resistance protein [Bradyrhizobium sp. WBAH42]|nr:copper resistance protein [Bradyrhizobium sp. WBAH30]MDD1546113.1 copper resistance protein [Bradyrhizobium sp. WBAH41]MDD1559993.1 copper resistance protein [Bradyrhizobium sp. WBAH23]MDD1567095.1 copper resistance protein [Bradyrhizobium sp. WBAH33]MDD1593403.1 copper resistance protein [Bradyrhizobium sp. WBAH42]NRB90605.1 copper resistance protein [Bradyrhizobium sp. WBAH10]QCJ87168.1 copper resistance protein [Bradyrhizobium yuanmingense]